MLRSVASREPGPQRRGHGDHWRRAHLRRYGRRVPVRARPETTARTYAGTLEHLAARLGRDRPFCSVTDDELAGAASELWGASRRAPGTGTSPPSGRSRHGAAATGGPPGTCT